MFNKKMTYDVLGIINATASRACYGLSQICNKFDSRIAMKLFNIGNDRAKTMMKYWIKSTNCEDDLDVERVVS